METVAAVVAIVSVASDAAGVVVADVEVLVIADGHGSTNSLVLQVMLGSVVEMMTVVAVVAVTVATPTVGGTTLIVNIADRREELVVVVLVVVLAAVFRVLIFVEVMSMFQTV